VVVAAFTPFLAQSIAVVGQPRVEGAKPVRHSEREVSGRRNSRAVDASNNVSLSDLTRLTQAWFQPVDPAATIRRTAPTAHGSRQIDARHAYKTVTASSLFEFGDPEFDIADRALATRCQWTSLVKTASCHSFADHTRPGSGAMRRG
jgi:hypothetical protein